MSDWKVVHYTDGYDQLFSIPGGKRSSFSKMEIDGELYYLKVFSKVTDEKCRIVDCFRDLSYDGIHAFPCGKVYVYDRDEGYLCKGYSDALNFGDSLCDSFPYELKYQATLDTSSQLRFLHQNGFIANDIRLNNNIISCHYQHGMMVDFEEMILENNYIKKPSSYRFFDEDWKFLPASKWEDTKKQFICNASLLLEHNFEKFAINHSPVDLLYAFSFDKEIYDFVRSSFLDGEMLYFDEIAPKFQDVDKIKHYAKQLKI